MRLSVCFPVSPAKPEEMDWSELYPEFFTPLTKDDQHDDPKDVEERTKPSSQVEFADIGCGYGGLLGNFIPPPWFWFLMSSIYVLSLNQKTGSQDS